MDKDNISPDSRLNGTGVSVLEPPPEAAKAATETLPEAARVITGPLPEMAKLIPEPLPETARTTPVTPVTPEPQIPTGSQPYTTGTPTYPQYVPTQESRPSQPGYGYETPAVPQPRTAAPERKDLNPLVVVLSVLGALVVLGLVFVIAAVYMLSNAIGGLTNPAVGELQTETQAVSLGAAKSAVVDVSMGVGKLYVSGGATDLMNATFTYNVAAWKPSVSYNVNGTEGTLIVKQPSQGAINSGTNTRYEWNLLFKNDVPMTMKVDMGVGEGSLKFGGITLSKLEVNSGVGNTTIDLTGVKAPQDVSVLVNGGVGQVNIILPQDIGVRVTAEGGLGRVNASGLTVNDKTYTNSAYGTTPSTININVKTGIGDISLVQGR